MNRMGLFLLGLLLLPLAVGPSLPSDEVCGPCKVKTAPPAKTGTVTDPEVNFVWYSDADKASEDGDAFCYIRYIRNLNTDRVLRFEWAAAGLKSERLAANGISKLCLTYGKPKDPASKGPIIVGYHDEQVAAQVWEAQDEPPLPSSGMQAHLEFDLDDQGLKDHISFRLSSQVVGQQYTYRIQNSSVGDKNRTGPSCGSPPAGARTPPFHYTNAAGKEVDFPYKFAWRSASSPSFLKEFSRSYGKPPLKLLKGKFQVEFSSEAVPQLVTGYFELYDKSGKVVAAAAVPAWVPTPVRPNR